MPLDRCRRGVKSAQFSHVQEPSEWMGGERSGGASTKRNSPIVSSRAFILFQWHRNKGGTLNLTLAIPTRHDKKFQARISLHEAHSTRFKNRRAAVSFETPGCHSLWRLDFVCSKISRRLAAAGAALFILSAVIGSGENILHVSVNFQQKYFSGRLKLSADRTCAAIDFPAPSSHVNGAFRAEEGLIERHNAERIAQKSFSLLLMDARTISDLLCSLCTKEIGSRILRAHLWISIG